MGYVRFIRAVASAVGLGEPVRAETSVAAKTGLQPRSAELTGVNTGALPQTAATAGSVRLAATDGFEALPRNTLVEAPAPSTRASHEVNATSVSGASVAADAIVAPPIATVDGWELSEVLGRGGQGEVFAAERSEAEGVQRAAMKFEKDAVGESGLEREERLLGKLADSENVVNVLGSGTHGDQRYLALERLDARDLNQRIHSRPEGLSPALVIQMVRDIASALEDARAAGITHLDMKPANILRDSVTGRFKLSDFGIAQDGADKVHVVGEGSVLGTKGYMAPEHVRGEPVDHRADVFGLGNIAYEALTGQRAFFDEDPLKNAFSTARQAPIRPSALDSSLHEDVDDVLALALAKDPALRFQSAAELSDALEAAVRGELPLDIRRRASALWSGSPAWREL